MFSSCHTEREDSLIIFIFLPVLGWVLLHVLKYLKIIVLNKIEDYFSHGKFGSDSSIPPSLAYVVLHRLLKLLSLRP